MDDWGRFFEEQLPDESDFYSGLILEEISGIDYRHAEKVFNKFNIKNLGEYHDLYVQSDILLLADVFENFRNICFKVYGLDPVYFFVSTRISMASLFKENSWKIRINKRCWYAINDWKRNKRGNMPFCI